MSDVSLEEIRSAIAIIRALLPILRDAGDAAAGLVAIIRAHKDHPGLSDAEKTEVMGILEQDPAAIGVIATVPVESKGVVDNTIYFAPLPGIAPTIVKGDRVYRLEDGNYWIVPGYAADKDPAFPQPATLLFTAE